MHPKTDRAAWLQGGKALCNFVVKPQKQQHRFVLLGAPGAGKGTQAELLSDYFNICPLSTGDIFRAFKGKAPCECTPAMQSALRFMVAGELVPDETVLALLRERARCLRCGGGFLLDGFPRTIAQAEALEGVLSENGVKLDAVINYELPLEIIVARLSGRRTCPECKRVYHVDSRPPKKQGVCDDCAAPLFLREDDRPEAIRVRMEAYSKSTIPLADFYRRKGILVSIQAASTPTETFAQTLKAIENATA